MTPGRSPRPSSSQGFTVVELLVALGVFAIIVVSVGFFYISTQRAFDYGTAQAYVQREGARIQERIRRLVQDASGLQVVNCGPNTVAGRSLLVLERGGLPRCVFQFQAMGDNYPQLYLCEATGFFATAPCQVGSWQSLLRWLRSEIAPRYGAELRVSNTTFSAVANTAWPAVDVRFDLNFSNPATGQDLIVDHVSGVAGLRFGFSLASRN